MKIEREEEAEDGGVEEAVLIYLLYDVSGNTSDNFVEVGRGERFI